MARQSSYSDQFSSSNDASTDRSSTSMEKYSNQRPNNQGIQASDPQIISSAATGEERVSPALPPIPKRDTPWLRFEPIGPIPMGMESGETSALGESSQHDAVRELQQTLKKDLASTIFDQADLDGVILETHAPDSPAHVSAPVAADSGVSNGTVSNGTVTDRKVAAGETDSDTQTSSLEVITVGETTDPESLQLRRKRIKRRQHNRRLNLSWSFLWIMITACFSGVGVFAFRWMTSLPPAPNCEALSAMSADVDRLHCAHLAAKSGTKEDLLAGFDLVRSWDAEHPSFWKAQSMMERWTKDTLGLAEETLYSEGLDAAVNLVEAIPPTSPLADQVQATLNEWDGLWSHGESIVQTALDAVQSDQWDVAAQQVVELGKIEHDYWRQERANELSLRIIAERQGEQVYQEVKATVDTASPDELAIAMSKLEVLEPNTFIWDIAQPDIRQWSKSLADTSLERFQSGDKEGALSLVQALPARSELIPGASDLVRFGYAQRQATEDPENWTPGLAPLVGFMTALAAAEDIPVDSPFYDQAQIQMVQWRRQLQDLTQLQVAQAIASVGHRQLFDIAIEQAKMVPKNQPRRLQAQTLLAHWRQEIERVEDRPQLALAHRMAESGSIEGLQKAIAQAETVDADRALRQDADTAIAQWTGQIQTIEDQPILDSALTLAESGNLNDAITKAAQIGEGRALYGSAQAKIGEWRTTLAIAQNQRLLARARSLAGQTRLTEAINVASGVSSATPALYREARASMAQWRSQRDQIWAARNAAPARSPSPARSSTPRRSAPAPSPAPAPAPSPSPASFDGYYGPSYNN